MKRILISSIILIMISFIGLSQTIQFTRQDSLRGSITPERSWWDLAYYHLDIRVHPEAQSIEGNNLIGYTVKNEAQVMQIDLQPPMAIHSVIQNGRPLSFVQDGNAWFIKLIDKQIPGEYEELSVFYGGKPKENLNPPWGGGIAWKKDEKGRTFSANANQGDGASLWWPCKDHMYDEPDSMLMSIRVPDPLINVSNGRLRAIDHHDDETSTYHWFVSNPINNYGVNINIGHYVHFTDTFPGERGPLDCDYWVIDYNLDKAKIHFKQAHKMLEAFEHWFGPYPFYEDSYKLVEAPYPGMEHQSSVTYGNGYKNGFGGRDVSSTGYGMEFDFILVHESGHEWFANSITYRDVADMWIHESFIAYSENLYVDYFFGKEASAAYCRGTRLNISNDRPIIGQYDVNYAGSGDMYSKGANMLHTLRQIVNNDEKWRQVLRGLNLEFYHQTVDSKQIEMYIAEQTGLSLKTFFNQYLRDTRIPTFEYALLNGALRYRWANAVKGFKMPLKVWLNGEENWLEPSARWQTIKEIHPNTKVEVDTDFYVACLELTIIK